MEAFGDKAEEDYFFAKTSESHPQDTSELALFRNFKMELYPRSGGSRRDSILDPTATSEDRRTALPVLVVISLALKYIKDKVLERLDQNRPTSREGPGIRWVLTVPAVWNNFGKGVMREAAVRAGMISRSEDKTVSNGCLRF